MIKFQILLLIVCTILILSNDKSLNAQRTKSSINSGEQRSSEKGLKDNRYFFYFINPTVTNLADNDSRNLFKKAIQRDIISQILYMKFQFHESFGEIRKVQELLLDLYKKTLISELDGAKKLLNDFAPQVIKSNKYVNRHYLELGYKNVVNARQFMNMADNYQEHLYSLKLYQYVKAMKKAKVGKRYALLSLIFTRLDKKKDLKHYQHYGFEDLEKMIAELDPDIRENLRLIHYDNHYRTRNAVTFYDMIWKQPALQEIDEYRKYFNRND